MPPRYAYWTIIAGGLPTSFRAADREDLLPTFQRLRERHPDAQMKWFARGKLWTSPEEARLDQDRPRGGGPRDRRPESRPRGSRPDSPPSQARGRDWRPGGEHRDPKQKYRDAKKARNAAARKQRFERREGSPRGREQAGPPERRAEGGWKNERRFGHGPKPRPKGRPGQPGGARPFDRERPPARGDERRAKPFAGGGARPRFDRQRDDDRQRPKHTTGGSSRPYDKPRSKGAPAGRDRRDVKPSGSAHARPFDRARQPRGSDRGPTRPFDGTKRSLDRGGFTRRANQGPDEPAPPARPRGPNREPRPSENPPPSPPPRPSEPAIAPPGPPERGRNDDE